MMALPVKHGKLSKNVIINLILVAIVIGLSVFPILVLKNKKFAGADDKAGIAIKEINPAYKPWFSPILEPKSGEMASLLFALQASIGSGIVFFVLGYMVGKKKKGKEEEAIKR